MSKIIVDDKFLYKYVNNSVELMINNLPDECSIVYEFSDKFLSKMDKVVKRERVARYFVKFNNYAKRTAMIILILLCVALTTTMSVEAFRIRFFEIITEVWDEITSYIFENDNELINEKLIPIESDYIPKGYDIVEKRITEYVQRIFYQDNDKKEIIYEQKLISSNSIIVDTENSVIEYIKISNQEVSVLENKGIYQVYWYDELYTYVLIGDIEKQELLLMTKSIIKKNK